MNILVITQMYSQPDDVGDNKPTKTVNYFVKEWCAMGHRVVVMHCPSKFPYLFYCIPSKIKEKFAGRISTMVPPIESRRRLIREEDGVQVYRLPMLKIIPGQRYSVISIKRFFSVIKNKLSLIDFIPDLVAGHFANPSLELVVKLASYYNAKSSIVFHHDCTKSNIDKYRINKNIKNVGAIGARSIIEAKDIQKRLDLNELPFVCCSGVPNEALLCVNHVCGKHDYSNGVRHIYVGSLIKRKHLDIVIKAFINTANKNDTLTVVGGGPEEGNLKKLVKELNAEERIVFTGRISRHEVLEYMKDAQIFTLISHGETYGMVYIEAMLHGCLVIASKGEGFDGIIQDGINGFICEPGDISSLESIFMRIAKLSIKERNKIGQLAIDTALHYSEREVAERYLKDILNRQR